MRFIDLFAGLGGFHVGLRRLGHTPVYALESNSSLQSLYQHNFGIRPKGDIRSISLDTVPEHDILCAGFPCQPFSKAGFQEGFDCPDNGNLYMYIIAILRSKWPAYFILENVPNLLRHNDGKTWGLLKASLENIGYSVQAKKLSPHWFGVPQRRFRVFIVGARDGLENFAWPCQETEEQDLSIKSILDGDSKEVTSLPESHLYRLKAWQSFLDSYPAKKDLPPCPIWAMEFGATYPYEDETPFLMKPSELKQYRGSLGIQLSEVRGRDRRDYLPSYALQKVTEFPRWKRRFIRQNRKLYCENKGWLDTWKKEIAAFPESSQKFEWNCKGENRVVWDKIIQFRGSGIRVKRPTIAPTLVAMTTSQVPIIAWERRYLTIREAARLQNLDELNEFPKNTNVAFRALGNAVNAEVVSRVARNLIR